MSYIFNKYKKWEADYHDMAKRYGSGVEEVLSSLFHGSCVYKCNMEFIHGYISTRHSVATPLCLGFSSEICSLYISHLLLTYF